MPTCVTTGDLCDCGETGVPGEAVAVTVSGGVVP